MRPPPVISPDLSLERITFDDRRVVIRAGLVVFSHLHLLREGRGGRDGSVSGYIAAKSNERAPVAGGEASGGVEEAASVPCTSPAYKLRAPAAADLVLID